MLFLAIVSICLLILVAGLLLIGAGVLTALAGGNNQSSVGLTVILLLTLVPAIVYIFLSLS